MDRAVKLSLKGFGNVNPNPLVGAVIVKDGIVVGEGYHEFFGGPHAEINAINNSKTSLKGATLYVTLEPCNHFGKTPPCTDRIIDSGFSKVVIGMNDPNPKVDGGGTKKLQNAGIEVASGVLRSEIERINEVYLKYVTTGLPFISLKSAMTLDGKISTYNGQSKWISNELSRKQVHELRHRYAAIMVGVNTVIKDDPELTDRSDYTNKSNPLRIVVDSNGRTPVNSKVMDTEIAKTLIAVTKNADKAFIDKVLEKGAEVIICPEKNKKVDLNFLVKALGDREIDSILLEGGSTLNFSAIEEGLVDKVYSFISPRMLGGEGSKTPVGGAGFETIENSITLKIENIHRFGEDVMIESYIMKK